MLLPRGCVIKNVKVRRTNAGGGPSSFRQHQQQRAQGHSQNQSSDVIINEEKEEIQLSNKRKSEQAKSKYYELSP